MIDQRPRQDALDAEHERLLIRNLAIGFAVFMVGLMGFLWVIARHLPAVP